MARVVSGSSGTGVGTGDWQGTGGWRWYQAGCGVDRCGACSKSDCYNHGLSSQQVFLCQWKEGRRDGCGVSLCEAWTDYFIQ